MTYRKKTYKTIRFFVFTFAQTQTKKAVSEDTAFTKMLDFQQ